ncbi:MAG: hypothetical protein HGA96_06130 [Desulfobulbaceae bacterium]|nr:hypothetical protein [Desulfobulbaceae bacterium]
MEPNQNNTVELFDVDSAASVVGLMDKLGEIKGYKASAIMTCEGELLYLNSNCCDEGNLGQLMEVLNGFFERTCSLAEKSGFVSCGEVSLQTGSDVVVIRCSGQDCLVGIRLLVLVEERGNIAIMRRRLGKLLPLIMQCLTWEPDNLVPLVIKENAWRQRSPLAIQGVEAGTVN